MLWNLFQKIRTIYKFVPDEWGRAYFWWIVVGSLVPGVVMGWLFSKIHWFWDTLGLAGVLAAVLTFWMTVAITLAEYQRFSYHRERRKARLTPAPTLLAGAECTIDLRLEAKLYKGGMKADLNQTKFVLTIVANKEISQPRIYVEVDEMRSGWSGQDPFWSKQLENALVFDAPALHSHEVRQVEIGHRDGLADSPLIIHDFKSARDNNSWPYVRVIVTVNATDLHVVKSFVILAPGYIHNQILLEDQVPLSWDAIGPLQRRS